MNENDGVVVPASDPDPDVVHRVQGMWGVRGSGDTSGFSELMDTRVYVGPTSHPYGGQFDSVVDVLAELLEADGVDPDVAIEKVAVENGQLMFFVAREYLVRMARCLRDDQDLRSEMCFGITDVHHLQDVGCELHGYFPLLSIAHSHFLVIEPTCPESDPYPPSIVEVYPGGDWPEHEAWDPMEIVFDGHPGFTRTAIPGDWIGRPQRKDYSLGGIPAEYKGAVMPPPDVRKDYS